MTFINLLYLKLQSEIEDSALMKEAIILQRGG